VQLIDRDHCLSSANTTPGKPKESMIPNYGDHLDKQFLVERFPQQQRVQFIWTETKRLKYDRDYHRKQTNRVQGAKLSAMDAATHFLSPIAKLRALFPDGGSLPEEVWQKRYNFLLGLTWLHALVIALIGPVLGYSWELSVNAIFSDYTVMHTVFEGLLVALFAALGSVKRIRRTFQAASVALGLMSASAILVHLSGGYIEFHFHFFVMLVFLALLQDWVPYLLAVAYVGIHHGLVGALWPEEVFNHTAAINAPWTWAGIHAFFILWAAVGSIIAWRFNEKMLEKIKKQAAELEEANKLQADFAAMIAHDLRGPVSTVLNTAELMQDGVFGEVSDDQKEWLGKMQVTCRTVVDIVSDFLDISKIEAGKLELIKKKIDLYQLIHDSVKSYTPMATVKDISITAALEPGLPQITADERRLEQVLSNLITNALKFTGAGGTVEVGARRLNGNIKFWVKDTGDGIPADEISDLFEKYRQSTSGKISEAKGTGLGLAICKKITEAHGGKISVESRTGEGSIFAVEIPRH
jgi:signal transduction histidine kinase